MEKRVKAIVKRFGQLIPLDFVAGCTRERKLEELDTNSWPSADSNIVNRLETISLIQNKNPRPRDADDTIQKE